jgi:hypothetical protein
VPLVISIRARAPIGTTSSTPVKAVPPGLTVVGSTSSVSFVVVDLWIVVGPTVGEVGVVVVGTVVVVVGTVVVVVFVEVVVVVVEALGVTTRYWI